MTAPYTRKVQKLLRKVAPKFMHHRVTRLRVDTSSTDSTGRPTETVSPVKSGLRCLVQPADAERVAEFARNDMTVSHTIYFASDPEIQKDSRLRGEGDLENRDYYIEGADEPSELSVYWRIHCREELRERSGKVT